METNRLIARHLANHMNVDYVARVVCVPVDRVKVVQAIGVDGASVLYPDAKPRVVQPKPKSKHPVTKRQAFKPLTGDETVIELVQRGLSAEKIRKRLGVGITARAINRYAVKKLGASRTGGVSKEHQITPTFMPYVVEALSRLGKDPNWCECCEERQVRPCTIHHTKYEGATIYDLAYVCTSCNNSRENRGLI